ncbi:MAG TPA: hypothetical protein VJ864_14775, partial [Candidatus Binatia bacterium]|nr:hypothetical protein [Candidatus Binatia bacterium]
MEKRGEPLPALKIASRTINTIGKEKRIMRRSGKIVFASLALFILASTEANGATIAEVAAKTKSLKQKEKLEYLAKGAQAEGEMVYYGTLPIDEFLPLAKVFNARYRALALQHYFSPRQGILNRALTE